MQSNMWSKWIVNVVCPDDAAIFPKLHLKKLSRWYTSLSACLFWAEEKNIEDIVKWGFLLLLCFSYSGSLLCAFNFTKAFSVEKQQFLKEENQQKRSYYSSYTIYRFINYTYPLLKKNSSIFTTFLYNYIPIHSAMQYDLHFSHHQEGRA